MGKTGPTASHTASDTLTFCWSLFLVPFPVCLPGSWAQSYEISDTDAGHRLASLRWKALHIQHPKAEQMAKISTTFRIQAAVRVMLARHCFGHALSIYLSNIELFWDGVSFCSILFRQTGIFEIFGYTVFLEVYISIRAKRQAKSPTSVGEAMHGTKLGIWHDDLQSRFGQTCSAYLNIETICICFANCFAYIIYVCKKIWSCMIIYMIEYDWIYIYDQLWSYIYKGCRPCRRPRKKKSGLSRPQYALLQMGVVLISKVNESNKIEINILHCFALSGRSLFYT